MCSWNTIRPLSISHSLAHTSIHLSPSIFEPSPCARRQSCPTPVLPADWSLAKIEAPPLNSPITTLFPTCLTVHLHSLPSLSARHIVCSVNGLLLNPLTSLMSKHSTCPFFLPCTFQFFTPSRFVELADVFKSFTRMLFSLVVNTDCADVAHTSYTLTQQHKPKSFWLVTMAIITYTNPFRAFVIVASMEEGLSGIAALFPKW